MLGTAGTLVVVLGLAGSPPSDSAVRQVLEKERCQVDLPLAGEAEAPAGPVGGPGRRPPLTTREAPLVVPLPPTLLSSLALAVLIAIVLALLLHRLPAPGSLPAAGPRAKRPAREPPPPTTAAGDPDRLAGQGRFAEAIHALLLRALRELGPGASRPELTSREVLRGSPLAPEARLALGALVSAVEWAHFGAKPVGAADYEASLAAYRRLGTWRGRE